MRTSSHEAALRRNGKALPCARLPLFHWAESHVSRAPAAFPETLVIRSIARRFRVPVHLARVIAENANLGGIA